jgi:enamine deaminase RidA (YjgF/YER057c/UK114 family)
MPTRLSRRRFFRDGLLLTTGLAGGSLAPRILSGLSGSSTLHAAQDSDARRPEQRLRELGIQLPPAPKPVAVYVPGVVSGNMLYASGHGPRTAGGTLIQGRVGDDLTLMQGYEAARLVGLNVLSTIRNTISSLDQVVRLVKVLGMVNSTSDFKQHPAVINGFSELMVEVFGETNGKGARSAVGMGSLPSNIPVEIEAIFEIRT